jgi:hypothetical protein
MSLIWESFFFTGASVTVWNNSEKETAAKRHSVLDCTNQMKVLSFNTCKPSVVLTLLSSLMQNTSRKRPVEIQL